MTDFMYPKIVIPESSIKSSNKNSTSLHNGQALSGTDDGRRYCYLSKNSSGGQSAKAIVFQFLEKAQKATGNCALKQLSLLRPLYDPSQWHEVHSVFGKGKKLSKNKISPTD